MGVFIKRIDQTFFMIFLFLLMSGVSYGNDTAMNNGIYGPEPIDMTRHHESPLRLEEEHLLFEFGEDTTWVKATFLFKNTDQQRAVTQLTGFPDTQAEKTKWKDYNRYTYTSLGPLIDLTTTVNGKSVTSSLKYSYIYGEVDGYWIPVPKGKGDRIGWHVVTFVVPPGGDVVLERSYRVRNGVFGTIGRSFLYVTHTGSAWKGTIGKLTLEVALKDGLKIKNLYWSDEKSDPDDWTTKPEKRQWEVLAPDTMRLVWRDFEPRKEEKKSLICLVTRYETAWMNQAKILTVEKNEDPSGYQNLQIKDLKTGQRWRLQIKKEWFSKLIKNGSPDDLKVGRVIKVWGNLLAPGIVRVSDAYYHSIEIKK
jgi:hypothetical protein